MGNNDNNNNNSTKLKGEEIVLLLFTLFGILIVLFFLLIAVVFQTWALWKMSKVVVEANTEDGSVARRKSSIGNFGFFGGGVPTGGDEDVAAAGKKRYE